MAARTFAEISARFLRVYPDASATVIATLLNKAHQEISIDFPLLISEAAINLTADDYDYQLTNDTAVIWKLFYDEDADSRHTIELRLWEDIEAMVPNWRSVSASRPTMAAMRGGQLFLYPKPPTSTSGTYPRLWMVKSVLPAEISGSSTIADTLPDEDTVFYRMCRLYAEEKRDFASVPMWEKRISDSDIRLQRFLAYRIAGSQPRIQRSSERRKRVV